MVEFFRFLFALGVSSVISGGVSRNRGGGRLVKIVNISHRHAVID